MATSLPLLNLPPTVSEQVLQKLTFPDLFDLSQCSKRTFNLIKASIKKRCNIMVTIDSTSEIKITNENLGSVGSAAWMFYEARDPARVDLEDPRTYKVDGMRMKFCRSNETNQFARGNAQFGCLSSHSTQEFIKFCEHILTLFNATVFSLDILSRKKGCLEQLLSIEAFRNCNDLDIDMGKLSHEEMRKILTGFPNTEEFCLMSDTKKNFICDQPVKFQDITAYSSSWINAQFLRNMEFKQASLNDSSLTNKDLNSYLKHWLEGSNSQMEYLCVSWPVSEEANEKLPSSDWDLSKIVEGIPTLPGAAKRQGIERYYCMRTNGVPYENGLDLKRESDGMLATVVLFKDHLNGESFLFEVWQVPDPNVVVG